MHANVSIFYGVDLGDEVEWEEALDYVDEHECDDLLLNSYDDGYSPKYAICLKSTQGNTYQKDGFIKSLKNFRGDDPGPEGQEVLEDIVEEFDLDDEPEWKILADPSLS